MPEYDVQCQNTIFGLSWNVKIGFRMLRYDIRAQFECQKSILNVKIRYSVWFGMSYIWPHFESQNRFMNVKLRYSA